MVLSIFIIFTYFNNIFKKCQKRNTKFWHFKSLKPKKNKFLFAFQLYLIKTFLVFQNNVHYITKILISRKGKMAATLQAIHFCGKRIKKHIYRPKEFFVKNVKIFQNLTPCIFLSVNFLFSCGRI